uniref:Putative secreted protein n=1 Tax=Anopheles triannulatus TaxID=58253 RepID=A0A2M4B6R0_9DIPT
MAAVTAVCASATVTTLHSTSCADVCSAPTNQLWSAVSQMASSMKVEPPWITEQQQHSPSHTFTRVCTHTHASTRTQTHTRWSRRKCIPKRRSWRWL